MADTKQDLNTLTPLALLDVVQRRLREQYMALAYVAVDLKLYTMAKYDVFSQQLLTDVARLLAPHNADTMAPWTRVTGSGKVEIVIEFLPYQPPDQRWKVMLYNTQSLYRVQATAALEWEAKLKAAVQYEAERGDARRVYYDEKDSRF